MSLQIDTVQSIQIIETQPRDNVRIIKKWITREVTINKRVMRLRAYVYLKVHWIETMIIWHTILEDTEYCTVPNNPNWITRRSFLDSNGNWLVPNNERAFERKLEVFNEWNAIVQRASYDAELMYQSAFEQAHYSVRRNALFIDENGVEHQIDLYCTMDDWALGVQIKNITSEVFHDPYQVRHPAKIYLDLERQFNYSYTHGMIPILIAPFIHRSFYNFTDRFGGLYCQTYNQLLDVESIGIKNAVKEVLHFGNVKALNVPPDNAIRWINRIPHIWLNHYSSSHA